MLLSASVQSLLRVAFLLTQSTPLRLRTTQTTALLSGRTALTPWKTPSRSPLTYYTVFVWGVYTNGDCISNYYSSSYGVRPALNLNPFLLVSIEVDENEETCCGHCRSLSEYTNDELIAELQRRLAQEENCDE